MLCALLGCGKTVGKEVPESRVLAGREQADTP